MAAAMACGRVATTVAAAVAAMTSEQTAVAAVTGEEPAVAAATAEQPAVAAAAAVAGTAAVAARAAAVAGSGRRVATAVAAVATTPAKRGNLGAGTQRHHQHDTVHAQYLLRTKKEYQPNLETTSPSPGAIRCADSKSFCAGSGRTCFSNRRRASSI